MEGDATKGVESSGLLEIVGDNWKCLGNMARADYSARVQLSRTSNPGRGDDDDFYTAARADFCLYPHESKIGCRRRDLARHIERDLRFGTDRRQGRQRFDCWRNGVGGIHRSWPCQPRFGHFRSRRDARTHNGLMKKASLGMSTLRKFTN